jgi:hypothetical protein
MQKEQKKLSRSRRSRREQKESYSSRLRIKFRAKHVLVGSRQAVTSRLLRCTNGSR